MTKNYQSTRVKETKNPSALVTKLFESARRDFRLWMMENEHIVRENNKELCFTVRWSLKKVWMKMRRSPLSWRGGDETVCVLANPNFTTLSLSTFTWGDFVNDLGEFRSIDKDAVKSRITHCFLFWGKFQNVPSNVFRHDHLMNGAFNPTLPPSHPSPFEKNWRQHRFWQFCEKCGGKLAQIILEREEKRSQLSMILTLWSPFPLFVGVAKILASDQSGSV